jgi:CRP-like cAMP-binding protein
VERREGIVDETERADSASHRASTDGAYEGSANGDAVTREPGGASAHVAEANRLLRALPPDEYRAVVAHLSPTRLRYQSVLIEPNVPISNVYFVREGVCSMIATEQEGGDIEVGTVGREGLVGSAVALGADSMPNRVVVQVEGEAGVMDANAFRHLIDERAALRHVCLGYIAYLTNQLSQAVACNRLHKLEERCARWLLMTHDRVHGDAFDITHEFLSVMLGVRRAGVTVAMGALQSAGIVQYSRGRVLILDRARLEDASCGCYRIMRTSIDRLLA